MAASATTDDDAKTKAKNRPQASLSQTLSFIFECGTRETVLFALGCLGGVLNGLVYPALAFLFSNAFSDISSASSNGTDAIASMALTFFYVGLYALFAGTMQSWSFEFLAYHAANNLRLQWFKALLRQDTAFFDINDVGGIANQIGPSSNKYRRGVGRKFGEGVQFLTTGVGGLVYALYSSWKVALVVLSITPLVSLSALMVIQINQTKGARAQQAYKSAGSVAYSSVASIKTVLSLNGVPNMISRYADATQDAFHEATRVLIKQGALNGSMLGSFMLLYCILTLFGSFLLYREVRSEGCDPSGGVLDNDTCSNSGPGVFGAMLGVAFAAQGISQFGNFSEAFAAARIAAHDALKSIARKPGAPSERVYRSPEDDDLGTTTHSKKSQDSLKKGGDDEPVLKAILPTYEIDSTSDAGLTLTSVQGRISFKNVEFTYPTRPNELVLRGLSVDIEAGQTVAFVGPSGSGKSTVVGMVERFYDPQAGRIELDGVNLKDLNVASLRGSLGYVGQEPTLFACSIRENIRYGNPKATSEQVEEAARLANAHDFISSFADGYETQVGDKGSQLSGGQKQRIAIARVLVSDPKLLILDEATSALDVESELVVQEALDNILQHKKITTIIIAHRLSTIRNCDIINVLVEGTIRENGTHKELMDLNGYYRKLVEKQEGGGDGSGSEGPSRTSSAADLKALDTENSHMDGIPHISFKEVLFAYPTRPNRNVFKGFNLDIERGSTVALVGSSGGGKSTTVGLIERFYDPIEGLVEYNGMDLKSLNIGWYRDKIGYVGQEPTLFNDTIANNIAFGYPAASRKEIEMAAKQANAHDFIMSFSEGYDTPVGERGTQISGGQKQRIAIARALVKKPEILILDEATSALDNESESIVQAAIDKLMESRNQTCIVIAHRLSTIRAADKIAVVSDGKVVEQGSHDELVAMPDGRYKRLFASSKRDAKSKAVKSNGTAATVTEKQEEEIDWEAQIEEEAAKTLDTKRALSLAAPDIGFILIGALASLCAGAVFPLWGLFFSETINILFVPIFSCDEESQPEGVSCADGWEEAADFMREQSFTTAGYWALALFMCMAGFTGQFYGFGMASERLNKRVRDSTFKALLRQEVAYFDKQSVGFITSQLQDDAARIHAFSGEPIRAFLTASSSVIVGVTLAFIYMWQFALLAIACIPVMGFATSLEMAKMMGEDESDDDAADGKNSPGGIIVETLLNMRTVAALTLERQRFSDYEQAIAKSEPNVVYDTFLSGVTGGVSMFIQQGINALQFWFGGFLLDRFPETYEFKDFLIANFAILFSLFGLGGAFQDISDRKEVEKSAGRIFYLLDRVSAIDPLSEDGLRLDSAKQLSKVEEPLPIDMDAWTKVSADKSMRVSDELYV